VRERDACGRSGRRGRFCRGAAIDSNYLLIAALAVAVAGVAVGTYFTLRKSGPTPADVRLHFQCADCGHQFSLEREALPKEALDRAVLDPNLVRLDCPSCKAKQSCLRMVRCPHCGELYVPDSIRAAATGERDPDARDVCPHCQTDRLEWYRRRSRK